MVTQEQKPLTLRRNFSWTFIGNLVYAGCQWGMLVVLAKLGSPEMVGQFTLGLAVTAPVIMFTNLQLRVVQATDANKDYSFSDYLGLRLIGTGLGIFAIAIIALFSGYRRETCIVILLIGLAKAFESISDIFFSLLQQHERMDRIAISLMIKGPLSLLMLGAGVYLSHSVLWGTGGLVVAWAIVLITYDIRNGLVMLKNRSRILPRWHLKTLKKLIWLCLPLGFVMMLISLNANIPRYFIERYLGEYELGIFAAIAYLMVVGNMVILALGESASPRLAKYYSAGNAIAFRNLLLKLVAIAVVIAGGGILFAAVGGRQILTLIYRPEYSEHSDLFIWLMVAAGIGYIGSFLGYGMTASRYFRVQMPIFITVAAISAVACFWLLPKYGLFGGAIALNISATVQTCISLGVILHGLRKINKYSGTKPEIV
ncbi:lipopolysaccharide biosynthesis protein [Brunnivagina elsteri]|uniref:Polysaccharide biosynthesis protein n=1 Tax=Brunnivagina elsteri CCALA 953 TaxID=987040 RepID=A0A2A2TPE4_9CYAN|nr:oligosaccharide flippase family protein [Calothrix elsteri]PAX60008.1 polysaccharide biosynthesis protein [Calothrix elsteri CCALA 953]